jgi:hypothetical protein
MEAEKEEGGEGMKTAEVILRFILYILREDEP